MNKIKAVIFDIGKVLQLARNPVKSKKGYLVSGVHNFVAKKLGLSIDEYFDSLDSAYFKSIEGKTTKNNALKAMARSLGTSSDKLEKLFIKAYRKKFKQNKKLYRIAFNLKKRGYKIAILSDQWHISKEALIKKRWNKKFNVSIYSCDVGMRKPNPKIFKLILKKLKIKPKEAIFVDDQKWNTEAAKKLGLKSILFKNNIQLIKNLRKLGVEI